MSGIYALTEHQEPGELDDVSYEMLSAGRTLADELGEDLAAVVMGADASAYTDELGVADRVLAVEDDSLEQFNPMTYSAAAEAIVDEEDPRLVLTSVTTIGMDVASTVASESDVPLVTYVDEVDADGDDVVATSQLYGGKMNVDSELEGDSGILAISAGAFEAEDGREAGTPDVEEFSADLSVEGVQFVERHEPEAGDVDIAQEDRLLAIGRGIDDEDNIPTAEEAAEALDAALASSRPLIDNDWLPKNRQVGKSGKTVTPELYVSAGISGAPEHIEGMEDSELIVAINTDQEAPIFDHADYGIAADLFDVLPALAEQAGD